MIIDLRVCYFFGNKNISSDEKKSQEKKKILSQEKRTKK